MFACCCCAKQDDTAMVVRVGAVTSLDEYSAAAERGEAEASGVARLRGLEVGFQSEEEEEEEEERQLELKTAVAEETVFTAVLQRLSPEENLGMQADFADETVLHLCLLSEGDSPISRYNAATPERPINTGDYFLSVNGVSSATVKEDGKVWEALREQLTAHMSIEVLVSRPLFLDVRLERGRSQNIGLDLSFSSQGIGLIINEITDGAAQTASPELKVGDRIIAVNGTEGEPQRLLQAFRCVGEVLMLRVSRPHSTPEWAAATSKFAA